MISHVAKVMLVIRIAISRTKSSRACCVCECKAWWCWCVCDARSFASEVKGKNNRVRVCRRRCVRVCVCVSKKSLLSVCVEVECI